MVFDTNVLVYAADEQSPLHLPSRARLAEARLGPERAYLTWSICYEFLRVTTHPRAPAVAWTPGEAWGFLSALIESPGVDVLEPTPQHGHLLAQTLAEHPQERGNVMHDIHTAVLMREHGVSRICTRDRDFRRFPFLTVVDPEKAA